MARRKRVKPPPCIFCGASRVYPDAVGAPPWQDRCTVCGWNQVEDGWFRQMYQLPMEMELPLQCPFFFLYGPHREKGDGKRCTHLHTFKVKELLGPEYNAQFRCPRCDTWGVGKELLLNNKEVLKRLVAEKVTVAKESENSLERSKQ